MRNNYLALSTEIPLHYHMNRIPQDGSDNESNEEDETELLNPAAEEEGQPAQKKKRRGNAIKKRNPTTLETCLFWCDRWTCKALGNLCGNCKDGCMENCGKCQLDNCECKCDCDPNDCCPA